MNKIRESKFRTFYIDRKQENQHNLYSSLKGDGFKMEIKTGITGKELKKLRSAVGWVDVSVEQLQRAVEHSMVTVGIYEDGEIIGCGRLVSDFSCKSKLTDIIVLPKYQKKGYGRKIVQRLFDEAEKMMGDGEYLSIGADPTPGHLEFYKNFGMEEEGEMAVSIWLKK